MLIVFTSTTSLRDRIIGPILQRRKLRLRDRKELAQGHTVNKQQWFSILSHSLSYSQTR